MALFNHYEIKGFDRAFGPGRLHRIARECGSVIGWKERYTSDLYWEASFHLPVFTKQCIERKMNESADSKDIQLASTEAKHAVAAGSAAAGTAGRRRAHCD